MKKYLFILFLLTILFKPATSQIILNADGPGNTYELINSVLAPGANVIETPDCAHPEFGRHIDEVFDSTLNKYVFRFHIHVTPDNDRCIYFDRQRCEIKTYSASPANLKGVEGELVEYKWKFKLDSAFQSSSSFTHIHQIKAVDGPEESMPLITFTTRKGNPDQFELRYAKNTTQTTLKKTDLTPFKGEWIDVTERILYGEVETGEYEVTLSKVSDSTILFSYSNYDIRMWKTDASFQRPKWGIYRSLNDAGSLRDEQVLFSDFSIEELDPTVGVPGFSDGNHQNVLYPNPFIDNIQLTKVISMGYNKIDMYNSKGQLILSKEISSNNLDVSMLKTGLYILVLKSELNSPISLKMVKK
ncbi:MAG: heparin lyase I family protein [Bacteroidales bacterium]|nr:heparin lyase I family protein [Bacteroidales bacterium]MCF8391439.1 heparin lyase I family protein [Bacteroidales bacterium]